MLLLLSSVKSDLQEMLPAQKSGCELKPGSRNRTFGILVIPYLGGPLVAEMIPERNKEHQSNGYNKGGGLACVRNAACRPHVLPHGGVSHVLNAETEFLLGEGRCICITKGPFTCPKRGRFEFH